MVEREVEGERTKIDRIRRSKWKKLKDIIYLYEMEGSTLGR